MGWVGIMEQQGKPFIVLLDHRDLRSAALQSLLQQWTEAPALEIRRMSQASQIRNLDPTDCRMCLLDVGQASLETVQTRVSIGLLQTLFPDSPVVVVSDNVSVREIQLAREAGIRGFIPAATEPAVFFAALDLILHGGTYIPHPKPHCHCAETEPRPSIVGENGDASDISEVSNGAASDQWAGTCALHRAQLPALECLAGVADGLPSVAVAAALSVRQEEVLTGIRAGKSNKAIARDLDLSEATVKIHVRQLLRKLGVSNRTQVALVAASKEKIRWERSETRPDSSSFLWVPGEFGALASN